MIRLYIITFCISLLSAYFVSYFFARYKKIGTIFIGERVRFHKYNIPRVGGIVVLLSLLTSLSFLIIIFPKHTLAINPKSASLILGCLLLFATGFVDDIKPLNYRIKFSAQVLSALLLIFCGLSITKISIPFGPDIALGLLGYLFLIVWVIAIVNAINIIDGLDGLCTGIVALAALGIFAISLTKNPALAILSISLFAICLGFLRFNFYPARLFLGDNGSLVLGFLIAAISLIGSFKRAFFITFGIPILVLFVPLTSISFTFLRRLSNKKSPFRPDLLHLHYRLLRAGLHHRKVVILFYAATSFSVVLGVACYYLPIKYELLLILLAAILVLLFYFSAIYYIRQKNKQKRKNPRLKLHKNQENRLD